MPLPRRIGIMGGSFDPIHIAHLLMAETVRESLSLDLVLFLPAGTQPLKQGKRATPAAHRVAMVELAIASNPAFALSRLDVDRAGPSYTADSIEHLRQEWGGPEQTALWFIIGSDSLLTLPQWREPDRIIAQARLAIVRRPTFNADISPVEAKIPGITAALDWVDAPLMEISGTEIRRRAESGLSIRYMVPERVREYIEIHALYKRGA
ncbi:MAG: nicotinate-nucleotide adenylyltransferase [Chloroflexota bacterium]